MRVIYNLPDFLPGFGSRMTMRSMRGEERAPLVEAALRRRHPCTFNAVGIFRRWIQCLPAFPRAPLTISRPLSNESPRGLKAIRRFTKASFAQACCPEGGCRWFIRAGETSLRPNASIALITAHRAVNRSATRCAPAARRPPTASRTFLFRRECFPTVEIMLNYSCRVILPTSLRCIRIAARS